MPQFLLRTSRTARTSLLMALAALVPALDAHAQAFASANVSCFPRNRTQTGTTTASVSRSCQVGSSALTSTASVTNGVLRTSVSVSLDANSSGVSSGNAVVTWTDLLTITGGSAAVARFDFAVSGTNTRTVGNEQSWFSDARAVFRTNNGSVQTNVREYGVLYDPTSIPYLSPSNVQTLDLFSLFVPVFGGQAYLSYDLRNFAGVTNPLGPDYSPNNPAMTASSDFGSTAGIVGVTFLDANQQIVNDVSYSFLNGTTFYTPSPPVTTVPEPGALLLLASGLLAFGLVRHARGQRSRA